MDREKTKRIANEFFEKAGDEPVKNFAAEFADGTRFQRLFNLIFDEQLDCGIEKSDYESENFENWKKINGK